MIYFGTPYSDVNPAVVNERVHLTLVATASLIRRGLVIYSPIAHCHDLALRFGLPTDAAFWERINRDFLEAAKEFYALCIPGWRTSIGLTREFEIARQLKLPIGYVTMDHLNVRISPNEPVL
jgi:hypothetical protein